MITYEYSIIINGTRLPTSHVIDSGSFQIVDNGIRSVSGKSVLHVESDSFGYTEVLITPDYENIADESGIFFRGTDQDNGFYLLNQPSTGTLRVVQLEDGVETEIFNEPGTNDSDAPRVIKAVYSGTTIDIYEDNVQIGSSITATFNQTGNLSGLTLGTELVSADNFTFQSPVPNPKTITFGLPVDVQGVDNLYWSIARVSLDNTIISGTNLDTSESSIDFAFEDHVNVTNGEVLVLIITSTETIDDYNDVVGWSSARVTVDGYQSYVEGFGKSVNNRGNWEPFTGYKLNDSWTHPNGNEYLVMVDYTSGSNILADVLGESVIGYIRDIDVALNKAFRFPTSYDGNASTRMPEPVANRILSWNSTGTALVNAGMPEPGVNGDTIFEVFQYSSDNGVTDTWHDVFDIGHGDKWRRHATSTNGVVGEWSDGYNLMAEDGEDGDTIYIQYRYSTDSFSWHSDFTDGDVWRSERTITNGIATTGWSAASRIRGADGVEGEISEIEYQYSIDGLTLWHSNFSTGDHYRQERVAYFYNPADRQNNLPYLVTPWSNASKIVPVNGEDYGYKQATVYMYQKSETRPNAPTADITYNFLTFNLDEVTEGWLETIPDGKFDLWIAVASVWSLGNESIITPTQWVVELLGAAGRDGVAGSFTSFIYKNALSLPDAVPDEGSYDGVIEVIPTGWTDDILPLGTDEITYVATAKYVYDSDNQVWIRAARQDGVTTGWSEVREFSAFAGDTIYIEYQHSADNIDWHDDYLETDYYRRERTITISGLTTTEGAWTVGKLVRIDGSTPVYGTDYFDGDFNSFVYKLSDIAVNPSDNVEADRGSYNGTTETVPVGWSDNPVYSTTTKTQVSTCRYKHTSSGWVRSPDWSDSVQWLGTDGAEGLDGNYTSFVYRNSVTKPSKPTNGSFNGSVETLPTLPEVWTDNPVDIVEPEVTWVSKTSYATDVNGNWTRISDWSTPTQWTGSAGAKSASVLLYYLDNRNLESITAPALPDGETTYTFSTGKVTGSLNGWVDSHPDNSLPGGIIWVTNNIAFASATETTDTLDAINWATPSVLTANSVTDIDSIVNTVKVDLEGLSSDRDILLVKLNNLVNQNYVDQIKSLADIGTNTVESKVLEVNSDNLKAKAEELTVIVENETSVRISQINSISASVDDINNAGYVTIVDVNASVDSASALQATALSAAVNNISNAGYITQTEVDVTVASASASQTTALNAAIDGISNAGYATQTEVTATVDAASASHTVALNAAMVDVSNAGYITQTEVTATVDAASAIQETALATGLSNLEIDIASTYYTKVETISEIDGAVGTYSSLLDAKFDQNTGVYGIQIKTAADAATSAASAATALAANIYDGQGNLSQAFIDDVSLVAVEADGATIASAISTFTVSAGGTAHTIEDIALASIDSDGSNFNAQWGVKTSLNDLTHGVGFYVNNGVTSFVMTADNIIMKNPNTTSTSSLPFVFENGTLYLEDAAIKELSVTKLVGKIQSADIENLSVTKLTGQIESAQISELAVTKLVGKIQSADIENLSVTKLVGQIESASIKELAVTKLVGQIESAQIAELSVTKLVGQIESASIKELEVEKLNGLVLAEQIESVTSNQIIGQILNTQITNILSTQILGNIVSDQIENIVATKIQGDVVDATLKSCSASGITMASADTPILSFSVAGQPLFNRHLVVNNIVAYITNSYSSSIIHTAKCTLSIRKKLSTEPSYSGGFSMAYVISTEDGFKTGPSMVMTLPASSENYDIEISLDVYAQTSTDGSTVSVTPSALPTVLAQVFKDGDSFL